ncbi:type 4a pilus biogenesis protein PilO [Methylomonas sp. HYX-M1]|uniref:type 4a pilus biogenesis protein PilO n=1 Tax=Methylomonas sp. HYX-M1 TaxID=3139307 RepID=UPI00345B8412
MNLSEINWDINAAGTWPTPVKIAAGVIVSVLVVAADIYYITNPQLDELNALEQEEANLKVSFETKQKKAINLPDYLAQLEQIESSLGGNVETNADQSRSRQSVGGHFPNRLGGRIGVQIVST